MEQGDLFSVAARDPLDIPEFLQRKQLTPAQQAARKREIEKVDAADRQKLAEADAAIFAKRRAAEARKRLSNDERQRLALKIDAAVRAGHDTFGKLRKYLGIDDKALRSGRHEACKGDDSLLTIDGRTYRPR
jgi:hypothetical protein